VRVRACSSIQISRKAREKLSKTGFMMYSIKRTLSGLDVNVGGHPGRRDEFRDAPENIILVQAHPNDIEFPTRVTVGACFSLHLHLLRQRVR
jgi:hypothetical protein